MGNFVASNGVELDEYGYVSQDPYGAGDGAIREARAEFFQHLRDKELGRWRDPEAPNFVVYSSDNPDRIRVADEVTGRTVVYRRDWTDGSDHGDTAVRYYEAHPESKPWLDAEPGEIWVLEVWGEELAYARTATLFTNWGTPSLHPTDTRIKSGYRIWPEEEL